MKIDIYFDAQNVPHSKVIRFLASFLKEVVTLMALLAALRIDATNRNIGSYTG